MRASLARGLTVLILLVFTGSQVCCAPYTITITASLTSAQEVVDAQASLTVLDLPAPKSLSEAKSCVDGTLVRIDSLVASTSSEHFADLFYAQQKDRVGGIGIFWDGPVACGDCVWILGGIATRDGERFIDAIVVEHIGN